MVIPKINSAHGSDTRNIINRAIDLINVQGKSIQDLVAEGQLSPEQYAQLISIVNGNVKKGGITADDLDKNNFQLDQTYMSDALLQMMAGNTPVNAVPADRSITTEKHVLKSIDNSILADEVYSNVKTPVLKVDVSSESINQSIFDEIVRGFYGAFFEVNNSIDYDKLIIQSIDDKPIGSPTIKIAMVKDSIVTTLVENLYIENFDTGKRIKFYVPKSNSNIQGEIILDWATYLKIYNGALKYSDNTPNNYLVINPAIIKTKHTKIFSPDNLFKPNVFNSNDSFLHLNLIYDIEFKIDSSIDFDEIVLTKFGLMDRSKALSIPTNDVEAIFQTVKDGVLTPLARASFLDYNGEYTVFKIESLVLEYVAGEFKIPRSSWNSFVLNESYYENNELNNPLIISRFVYEKVQSESNNVSSGITFKVNEKLSELSPDFHRHWKLKDKDLTVVMIGDSISTSNNYTTPRTDAMYRPPIMIEYSYPSYIEEILRWDGQEYKRYDAPNIFTETATTKVSKTSDNAWDWGENKGNKPSATRLLEGSNVSVAYDIPLSAGRCDFIYRTDYLNAASAKVTINTGAGEVELFDETTGIWVEAHNYEYSAKEKDEILTGALGNYRESVYQKRLKMRIPHSKNNGNLRVTITNNGTGRLTYWGIQHSPHNNFINFVNSARGGHGINALRNFERVDVDIHKPDLILMQHCILNEGVYTGGATPANKGALTPLNLANKFLAYIIELEGKNYSPNVISYTLFHAYSTEWLKTDSNEVNYFYGGETKYTGFDYPDYIYQILKDNNKKVLDTFKALHEESKIKSKNDNLPIMESVVKLSGTSGNTWTKDGTHHNNLGSTVVFEIMKNLFIS